MIRYANAGGMNSGAAQASSWRNEPALDTEIGIEFQVPVTGDLDNNTCRVGNHITTGRAPILSMCRELLRQGLDPDASLQIFRAGQLALKIRSVREAAGLTIEECGDGRPRFRAYRPPTSDVLSPARKIPRGAS